MLRRPSLLLPGHVTVDAVADASRAALRAFMVLDANKRALSEWLVGPYRAATSFGPGRLKTHSSAPPAQARHTTPMNIQDLVTMSKDVVRAAVEASRRGVDDLVELLPPVVQVIPVHDHLGFHGFVPVDEARTRLCDRALSLLVADYLTRPDDFLEKVDGLWALPRPPSSGVHSTVIGLGAVGDH